MILNIPDRAYSQYRDKPKLMKWLDIAHKMGGSLVDAAEAVRRSYDIDSSAGEQLNVLGRIVVADRGFIADISLGQVSFAADDDDAPQCGDDSAVFSEETAATDSIMSDKLYRLAIKSKIAKNNGPATIQSMLRQVDLLIPNLNYVSIVDNGNMSFFIEFQGNVDEILRWYLLNTDVMQRPAGVMFGGFIELSDFVQMGDDDAMFNSYDTTVFAPVNIIN